MRQAKKRNIILSSIVLTPELLLLSQLSAYLSHIQPISLLSHQSMNNINFGSKIFMEHAGQTCNEKPEKYFELVKTHFGVLISKVSLYDVIG